MHKKCKGEKSGFGCADKGVVNTMNFQQSMASGVGIHAALDDCHTEHKNPDPVRKNVRMVGDASFELATPAV